MLLLTSKFDSSLFVYLGEYTICILIYVDDMIIIGSDLDKVEILEKLSSEFAVRELGELLFLRGLSAKSCTWTLS